MPIIAGKGGGIYKSTDTGAALKDTTALGAINSWELNITADMVESTALPKTSAAASAKSYVAGTYGWKVNANGFMENSAPTVEVGTSYLLSMKESQVGLQTLFYVGTVICDGNVEGMEVNGIATRNFTFTGNGAISALLANATALPGSTTSIPS